MPGASETCGHVQTRGRPDEAGIQRTPYANIPKGKTMRNVTLPTAWDILQPNTIAELRALRGFHTIRALSQAIPEMPYSRLYKIEKGTCIPRESELGIIAERLNTTPDRLLLEGCTAAEAAAWSKVRSGRVQRASGGDAQAVTLAAAIRYEIKRMGLNTAEILRRADLPWTNYHRLINAEQSTHRWSDRTMAGAMWIMGQKTWDGVIVRSQELRDQGRLDVFLRDLASPRTRLHPDDPDARAPWTDGITWPAVSRHPVVTPAQRQIGQPTPENAAPAVTLPDPRPDRHRPTRPVAATKSASPASNRNFDETIEAFFAMVDDMPYKEVISRFGADAISKLTEMRATLMPERRA
jgi:hypothetical protein